MKRDQILDTAKTLINGDRAKDYGDAYLNHQRIADGWNIIIKAAYDTAGLRYAHARCPDDGLGQDKPPAGDHWSTKDSWVDKAAYSALGAEFAEREKR
jgi:hypothetical protein